MPDNTLALSPFSDSQLNRVENLHPGVSLQVCLSAFKVASNVATLIEVIVSSVYPWEIWIFYTGQIDNWCPVWEELP